MTKRTKSTSTSQAKEKRDLTRFCAFWGLSIVAVLFVVTGILNIVGHYITINALVINIMDTIAKVALLIAVGIPAYSYVRGKGQNWKIFYWIALLIYALGVVFSVIRF